MTQESPKPLAVATVGIGSTASQLPDAKRRSSRDSIQTIRAESNQGHPRNAATQPEPSELSLWFQTCQLFLTDLIQNLEVREIKSMTHNKDDRRNFILQLLRYQKSGHHDDNNLSFLEFDARSDNEIAPFDDRSRTNSYSMRTSFTGSRSSLRSFSSQTSKSEFNDVQQSALAFTKSLEKASALLTNSSLRSRIFEAWALQPEGFDKWKMVDLKVAIEQTAETLGQFTDRASTIGFPDVGLELNDRDQSFQREISKYLETVRAHKLRKLRKLWKKPETWHWHQDCPGLATRTTEIRNQVQDALNGAIKSKDDFLDAACDDMNDVCRIFAQECGLEILDEYDSGQLVRRRFRAPQPDVVVGNVVLQYASPTE